MLVAGTMLLQCQQMLRGSITLMSVEPVTGVLLVQLQTPAVTVHLGQNRSG